MATGGEGDQSDSTGADRPELSNEDYGLLGRRALLAKDPHATTELAKDLIRVAKPMASRVPPNEVDDFFEALIEVGLATTEKAVREPVEKPRSYVMRSLRNCFVDELVKSLKNRRRQQLSASPEEFRSSADQPRDPLERVIDEIDSVRALERFLARCSYGTPHKAAQVVAVTLLLEISEKEACEVLQFAKVETETVRRMLRRCRKDPDSPLRQLLRDLEVQQ